MKLSLIKKAISVGAVVLLVMFLAVDVEAQRGGRGGGGRGFSGGGAGGGRGFSGGGGGGGGFSREGTAAGGGFSSRTSGGGGSYGRGGDVSPMTSGGRGQYGGGQAGMTDRTQARQAGMTDRTQSRQQGATNRQENRQDYYDDHWDGYRHPGYGYYGGAVAAGAVGAAVGYAAGAAGAYYSTLPCTPTVVSVGGATYYRCGSSWYNQAYSGSGVSYVVVDPPAGY